MTNHKSGSDHQHGLRFDLTAELQRRRVLGLLGAFGAGTLLAACDSPIGEAEANRIGKAADGSACVQPPRETAGPFPADGTNSRSGRLVNVLDQSGIIRQDMRPSFAGATGTAAGTPLNLTIALQDVGRACVPLAGYVVYLWCCDADGKYSLYDLPEANYLRAAGVSDAKGLVQFTSIFPGCYAGRWPHFHVEVFASPAKAATGRDSLLIAQFALPADSCAATYAASPVYAQSISNFARTSLERDGIFRNNTPEQLKAQTLSMAGDPATGMTATVTVGLSVA